MFVTWQMCDKSWQGFVTRDFAFNKSSQNSRTILVVESVGVLRLSAAGIVIIGDWTASMPDFVGRDKSRDKSLSRACHRPDPPLPICDMVQKLLKWLQVMYSNCFGPSWHSENVSGHFLPVFDPILAWPQNASGTPVRCKKNLWKPILKLQIVSSSEHQKVWANSSWALRTIHFPNSVFFMFKKTLILE